MHPFWAPFTSVSCLILMCLMNATAQISTFPYKQNFDSLSPPQLPSGWSSTQNRIAGTNDYTTTNSTPRSLPNAVLSTNATISQSLISPAFDFTGVLPDTIAFYTRRSSSHNASMVVEASLNGGVSYSLPIGDTLRNGGTTNYVLSAFKLPDTLATSSSARIRWRALADGSGTTGTIRIDDVKISVKATYDLSLATLRFLPSRPVEGDSIRAIIAVRNVGQQSVASFTVNVYHDRNDDSLAQQSELLASIPGGLTIIPGDSSVYTLGVDLSEVGESGIIAEVRAPGDQMPSNDSFYSRLVIGLRPQSLVVNEIMYAPSGPEPEWVEIHNNRSAPVNLNQWRISDNVIAARRTITTSDVTVPPGGYVILTRDSTALRDIHPLIPVRIISVPGFPTLNNSGDAVVLYDDRDAVMDSVGYLPSWGGSGGRSLERNDATGSSVLQSNWGNSRFGSTPGKKNSISRKDYDLKVDSLRILPGLAIINDSLTALAKVVNPGILSSQDWTLELYHDINRDSLLQPHEFLSSIALPSLPALDTATVSIGIGRVPPGTHHFVVRIVDPRDEDTTNNFGRVTTSVGFRPQSVQVNEIVYSPTTGMPEWVEITNSTNDTVNLKGWKIGNRLASRHTIRTSDSPIPPGAFLVMTKDSALFLSLYVLPAVQVVQVSSLPTFLWNNSGDAVVLQDNRGVIMDSVSFRSSWGGIGGVSLERLDLLDSPNDSTNWAPSQDTTGSTPGRANSTQRLDHDLKIVRVDVPAVSPGQDAEVTVIVRNVGKARSAGFVVSLLFKDGGDSSWNSARVVASTASGQQLSFRESTVVHLRWESPPPGKLPLRARIEYEQDQRLSNNQVSFDLKVGYSYGAIVINEIMYDPISGYPEYVELYNGSNKEIDLNAWVFHDAPSASGSVTRTTLSREIRMCAPGEYFVIAADTSILNLFSYLREIDQRLIIYGSGSSLSLNNDGDAAVLKDITGAVIDSVYFRPSWHNPGVSGTKGRALEKVHPRLEANDPRNWGTCVMGIGGTPGKQNSLHLDVPESAARLSFSPNPFSPDGDGREDVVLIQYDLPSHIMMIRVRIYDVAGRLVRTLVNYEPGAPRGEKIWDGYDDERQKARMGMYVVLLEAMNESGGVLVSARGVVVLAGQL